MAMKEPNDFKYFNPLNEIKEKNPDLHEFLLFFYLEDKSFFDLKDRERLFIVEPLNQHNKRLTDKLLERTLDYIHTLGQLHIKKDSSGYILDASLSQAGKRLLDWNRDIDESAKLGLHKSNDLMKDFRESLSMPFDAFDTKLVSGFRPNYDFIKSELPADSDFNKKFQKAINECKKHNKDNSIVKHYQSFIEQQKEERKETFNLAKARSQFKDLFFEERFFEKEENLPFNYQIQIEPHILREVEEATYQIEICDRGYKGYAKSNQFKGLNNFDKDFSFGELLSENTSTERRKEIISNIKDKKESFVVDYGYDTYKNQNGFLRLLEQNNISLEDLSSENKFKTIKANPLIRFVEHSLNDIAKQSLPHYDVCNSYLVEMSFRDIATLRVKQTIDEKNLNRFLKAGNEIEDFSVKINNAPLLSYNPISDKNLGYNSEHNPKPKDFEYQIQSLIVSKRLNYNVEIPLSQVGLNIADLNYQEQSDYLGETFNIYQENVAIELKGNVEISKVSNERVLDNYMLNFIEREQATLKQEEKRKTGAKLK